MRRVLFVILLLLPLAAAQEPDPFEGEMIHFDDERFYPPFYNVTAGQQLVLMNFGSRVHTVTSVDGAFDYQAAPGGEPTFAVAPSRPGTYRFYDRMDATPATHPDEGLAGVLVVHGAVVNDAPMRETPLPAGAALVGVMIALGLRARAKP